MNKSLMSVLIGSMLVLGSVGAIAVSIAADVAPSKTLSTVDTSAMGPQELIEYSAKRMLVELDANRPIYANDPAKLDDLVGNVLLPKFDTEYAARFVLGPAWKTATAEQRKRFVAGLYHSLLHNYGTLLVSFTADRLVILPYKGDAADKLATVRTEVKRSSGEKVPVNFSLHKGEAGWKAYDVVVEGISYLKSFKTDYAAEIQQKGLEELIKRLESEAVGHQAKASG